MLGARIGVLLAAGSVGWEVDVLRGLAAEPGLVLLKRCVDLHDLLASAATGQARVAVVSGGLGGLDADSVDRLRGHGVGVVVVGRLDGTHLPGVRGPVPAEDLGLLIETVLAAGDDPAPAEAGRAASAVVGPDADAPVAGGPDGRTVAVWGPTGAPGRTTLAVGLAAELAARGRDTLLVDADGYGGAVAQHLGVLDEVSGLLSAVRLANTGRLSPSELARVARQVGPELRVLTGLPRADRWVEVREGAYDTLLETARLLCAFTVLDLGFSLEPDSAHGGAPGRNHMTLAALERADELVVVGAADPVGLARLARGLVELLDVVPAATTRLVVNRVRPSRGWGEREVRTMVEGLVTPASIHFLPDDPAAADRALVAGRTLLDLGSSPLRRSVEEVADAVAGPRAEVGARRLRRRTAGRAR